MKYAYSEKIALAFTFVVSISILSGCAATTYKVGMNTYPTREEAVAAWSRTNVEVEAAITPGARSFVDRKLLIVVPTAGSISRLYESIVTRRGKTYAQVGTPARSQDDLNADLISSNFMSVASSLKKANIYKEVEVLMVDSTGSNIQPNLTQDVIIFSMSEETSQPTIYFNNAKNGKQVVAIDLGRKDQAERRKGVIDEIKGKALQ